MTSKKMPRNLDGDHAPNQQIFQVLFENHAAVMLLIDPYSGFILDANQSAVSFYGYPKSKLFGMSINEINILPPAEVEAERLKALAAKQNVFIFPHRLASGEERIVEVHSSAITLQDKEVLFSIIHDITDRKHAEKALLESENRFRNFINNSNEGISLVDSQNIIIEWNHACEIITGIPRIEALGRLSWEVQARLVPSNDRGLWTPEKLQSIMVLSPQSNPEPGLIASEEVTICTPAGETKIVLQSAFYFNDDKGFYFGVTLRDITERKKMEEDLRLFKTIIEESQEAIAISDRSGKLIYINPAHEKLFGHPLEKARLLNYRDYYPAESVEILDRIVLPRLERGEGWEGILEVFNHNGQRFPLWERAGQVLDADGNMLYGFGFMHNFTLRLTMEKMLRESKWRLENILNGTQTGTWEWNIQTGEVFINDVWAEIIGHTIEELAPVSIKTWMSFVHPDDLKRSHDMLEQHIMGDIPFFNIDCRLKHKNSDWVWVNVRGCIATRTEDGKPLMMFGVHIDISKRKLTESIQQAQLEINQISTDQSLDGIIQRTLDEIEILTHSQIGFAHFFEMDQKTVHLQMWSTNTMGKMCTVNGKGLHYPVDQAGVWADCIAARKPVVHNNYSNLTHRKGLPEGHAPILRELLVPVLRRDLVVMILGIGNKPNEYTDTDVEIAVSLADFMWDIVQRKKMEEALKQSENQYSLLAENMTDIIWLRDLNLNLLYVSPSEEKIRGYTLAELQQMPFEQLLTPDSYQLAMELFATEMPKVVANPSYSPVLTREFDFFLRDGRLHSVESKITIIRDEYGKPTSILGQDRDITERKLLEKALEAANIELKKALEREQQLARTDPLTGVNNRRSLFELAEREIEFAERYQHPFSIIMFDIDHFKKVNDTYGHDMGDRVLRLVAETASAELRASDVIGRFGGEEFMILLPMTNLNQAYLLAERIRTSMLSLLTLSDKGNISITLSLGVVEIDHEKKLETMDELFSHADMAMYKAKSAGRNRTVIFGA
jgi:diguanylate cyclase (GGDEF)-like protein/PAS domain S-box-containing protein